MRKDPRDHDFLAHRRVPGRWVLPQTSTVPHGALTGLAASPAPTVPRTDDDPDLRLPSTTVALSLPNRHVDPGAPGVGLSLPPSQTPRCVTANAETCSSTWAAVSLRTLTRWLSWRSQLVPENHRHRRPRPAASNWDTPMMPFCRLKRSHTASVGRTPSSTCPDQRETLGAGRHAGARLGGSAPSHRSSCRHCAPVRRV